MTEHAQPEPLDDYALPTALAGELDAAKRDLVLAVMSSADPLAQLRAVETSAKRMAVPTRHSGVPWQIIRDRLFEQAENSGIVAELGELTIATALEKSLHDFEPEHANGHAVELDAPRDDWEAPGEIPESQDRAAEPVTPARPLEFVSAASLQGVEIPPRRWLVPGRIPMQAVTILSGDGASGKTTIALQLCHAVVRGTDWLGAIINEPGPILFLSAEEDKDEIGRRLAAINDHHGTSFADLDGLDFKALPGEDSTLGLARPDGLIYPSPLYLRLAETARAIRPRLIVIEAAADVYAGNENDRGQVRQFVQLLRRLAIDADAAVVLIQHPSVAGLAEGQGRSGSTAWRNSARSQLYFTSAKPGADDAPDGDVRELRVVKSNYGPAGEAVQATWQHGVFVPVGGASSPARVAAEAEVDAIFLRLFEAAKAQGHTVGAAPGRNYAPAIFEQMPAANGIKARALAKAMARLLEAGRLKIEAFGPPSRQRNRLAYGPAGGAAK